MGYLRDRLAGQPVVLHVVRRTWSPLDPMQQLGPVARVTSEGAVLFSACDGVVQERSPAAAGATTPRRARSAPMLTIQPTDVARLTPLRAAYLEAMSAQVVHDSWHRRGFTSLYLLADGSTDVGYGAVGGSSGTPHDTVKEFFLHPRFVAESQRLFAAFVVRARPRWIEAQTNDPFLRPLLDSFAPGHAPWAYLFADAGPSALANPGVELRPVRPEDHASVFEHSTEPVGDWGLELDGALVATGGIFDHYNPPYGDLYMEVSATHRRRGFASYLVQELKRIAYGRGLVPAARCELDNAASRKSLERAGMQVCGQLRRGAIAPALIAPEPTRGS